LGPGAACPAHAACGPRREPKSPPRRCASVRSPSRSREGDRREGKAAWGGARPVGCPCPAGLRHARTESSAATARREHDEERGRRRGRAHDRRRASVERPPRPAQQPALDHRSDRHRPVSHDHQSPRRQAARHRSTPSRDGRTSPRRCRGRLPGNVGATDRRCGGPAGAEKRPDRRRKKARQEPKSHAEPFRGSWLGRAIVRLTGGGYPEGAALPRVWITESELFSSSAGRTSGTVAANPAGKAQ